MTLFEDLKWRGLIKDTAGDDLEKIINSCNATFYWGTDPTADSLHIGHYSSLVTAKRLAKAGHHPILLIGGATGLIGDPRPTAEREIISKEELNKNLEGIKKQVSDVFGGNVTIVNNYDWIKEFDFIDFLREVGKYIIDAASKAGVKQICYCNSNEEVINYLGKIIQSNDVILFKGSNGMKLGNVVALMKEKLM